jgi:tetratricopeptide (TPR) repeat protein
MPDEVMPSEEADEGYAPPDLPAFSDESEAVQEELLTSADGERVVIEEKVKQPETFWERLKKILFSSREGTEQRLRNLSLAIEKYPETPANYVLRGELYLDAGEYELAAADFRRALELASAQFEASDWGGIAQVMRDRAEAGLERARRLARE